MRLYSAVLAVLALLAVPAAAHEVAKFWNRPCCANRQVLLLPDSTRVFTTSTVDSARLQKNGTFRAYPRTRVDSTAKPVPCTSGYVVDVTPSTRAVSAGNSDSLFASVTRCGVEVPNATMTWFTKDAAVVTAPASTAKRVAFTSVDPGVTYVGATSDGGGRDSSEVTVSFGVPCVDDATNLLWYAGGEEETAPFVLPVNGEPDFTRWHRWDLNLIGQTWGSNLTFEQNNECGQSFRLEVRRTDSLLAGQIRAQMQVSDNNTVCETCGLTQSGNTTISGKRGDERWYGFSIFVPSDNTLWSVEPSSCPENVFEVFDKTITARTPSIFLELNGGNGGAGQWRWNFQTGSTTNSANWTAHYTSHTLTRGQWTDWVVHVKMASDGTGITQVWQNGVLVRDETGANIYSDGYSASKPVWGIYKWSWNGTQSGGCSTATKRVLYFDNIRVSDATGDYNTVAPR